MNRSETELAWAFEIQRAVVNEDAFLGDAPGDFERDFENRRFGLARVNIAGAEKHEKVAVEFKGFDAVFVQFERLVVDGADKIFFGIRNRVQHFARARKRLGLRIHEGNEFFARKRTWAIEKRPVEILLHRNLARVKSRKRKVVAIGELFPIEMKRFRRDFAGFMVPAVRQNNSADVPEDCVDVGQGFLHHAADAERKMRVRHQTIHENLKISLWNSHFKRARAGEEFQVAVRWMIE